MKEVLAFPAQRFGQSCSFHRPFTSPRILFPVHVESSDADGGYRVFLVEDGEDELCDAAVCGTDKPMPLLFACLLQQYVSFLTFFPEMLVCLDFHAIGVVVAYEESYGIGDITFFCKESHKIFYYNGISFYLDEIMYVINCIAPKIDFRFHRIILLRNMKEASRFFCYSFYCRIYLIIYYIVKYAMLMLTSFDSL